ncbi:MAG: GNAT family N-acetyltransferase [Candidatus Lokiarchaeota archaeon]
MDHYSVKRFQEYVMNAFPSKYYYFLNGWVLRFTGGITYRANSVFPINYYGDESQIEKDIRIVESAFEKFGLPTIFTMHDFFRPMNLDELLKNRGYKDDSHTNAFIAEIKKVNRREINRNYAYEIYGYRNKEFSNLLAKYTRKDEEQQEIISQISERIIFPRKCFIIARDNGKPIGTIMGVLNPEGYIYLSDLLVDPEYRRALIATSMFFTLIDKWGIKNNAKYIWLQVEVENYEANELYKVLGMKKAYYYYYLKSY